MILPAPPATLIQAPASSSISLSAAQVRRILIRLDYLPLVRISYLGVHGAVHRLYRWRFRVPKVLQRATSGESWHDPWNPFVIGALYQFEHIHHLPIDGGSQGMAGLPALTIHALLNAKKTDPWPWTWVLVTKFPRPESVHVFVAHRGWVLQSPVNTGILKGTPDGTWPVYARDPHTAMVGQFPVPVPAQAVVLYAAARAAGYTLPAIHYARYHHAWVQYEAYDDPDIRWVNYFDRGRALHYYPRANYGFPQSAGCVELPEHAARILYGLLHYGTPVTVAHDAASGEDPSRKAAVSLLPPCLTYREERKGSSPRSVHFDLVERPGQACRRAWPSQPFSLRQKAETPRGVAAIVAGPGAALRPDRATATRKAARVHQDA